MTQMSKLMHDTLAENNAQTQRQVSHLSQQLHAVATTADTNIQALHHTQIEMKQQLDQLQQTVDDKHQASPPTRTTTNDDYDSDDERQLQVIIHGFAAESDETTITNFTNNMLNTNALTKYVHKVLRLPTHQASELCNSRHLTANQASSRKCAM